MAKDKRIADLDEEISPIPAEGAGGGHGDNQPPPPFGSPKPAGEGALPRVVSELVRAGEGSIRYKIACRNYTPQPVKYVLAKNEDSASECYLASTKLSDTIARLKKNGVKEIDTPDLVVTVLKD